MTIRRLLPAALLAALALSSCEKEEVASASLLGPRWMLARIDAFPVEASSYSGTTGAYLQFLALGKSTVGLGPCNNFSGRFRLGSGQELTLTAPIATHAPCPVQDLENRYLNNLAATTRYEISGAELRLYDATAAAPRLVFRRAPQ